MAISRDKSAVHDNLGVGTDMDQIRAPGRYQVNSPTSTVGFAKGPTACLVLPGDWLVRTEQTSYSPLDGGAGFLVRQTFESLEGAGAGQYVRMLSSPDCIWSELVDASGTDLLRGEMLALRSQSGTNVEAVDYGVFSGLLPNKKNLKDVLLSVESALSLERPVLSILSTPPSIPSNGDRYLVGPYPVGLFVGHENTIATYHADPVAPSWVYKTPHVGCRVTILAPSAKATYEKPFGGFTPRWIVRAEAEAHQLLDNSSNGPQGDVAWARALVEAAKERDVQEVLNTPPDQPHNGFRCLVGTSPTGFFVGHADKIATYSSADSAFLFVPPFTNMKVFIHSLSSSKEYDGERWNPAALGSWSIGGNSNSTSQFLGNSLGSSGSIHFGVNGAANFSLHNGSTHFNFPTVFKDRLTVGATQGDYTNAHLIAKSVSFASSGFVDASKNIIPDNYANSGLMVFSTSLTDGIVVDSLNVDNEGTSGVHFSCGGITQGFVYGHKTIGGSNSINIGSSSALEGGARLKVFDDLALFDGRGGIRVSGKTEKGEYSARFDGGVQASEFNTTSDERIKDVIGETNENALFDAINNIVLTEYTLKADRNQKTPRVHNKLIAQQVAQVLPSAVRYSRGVVPTIMKEFRVQDGVLIWPERDMDLSYEATTENGQIVRIKGAEMPPELVGQKKLFVIGPKVDDLHNIDYDQITSALIASVQVLSRRVAELEGQTPIARPKRYTSRHYKLKKVSRWLRSRFPAILVSFLAAAALLKLLN